MTVSQGFYSLAVGSSSQATLNSLTFTLHRLPNYNPLDVIEVILFTLVFLAPGIVLMILGRSIVKRRL